MTMLFCIAESEIKVIHTYIHTYIHSAQLFINCEYYDTRFEDRLFGDKEGLQHYTTEESANASYLHIIGQRGGCILLGSYKSDW